MNKALEDARVALLALHARIGTDWEAEQILQMIETIEKRQKLREENLLQI